MVKCRNEQMVIVGRAFIGLLLLVGCGCDVTLEEEKVQVASSTSSTIQNTTAVTKDETKTSNSNGTTESFVQHEVQATTCNTSSSASTVFGEAEAVTVSEPQEEHNVVANNLSNDTTQAENDETVSNGERELTASKVNTGANIDDGVERDHVEATPSYSLPEDAPRWPEDAPLQQNPPEDAREAEQEESVLPPVNANGVQVGDVEVSDLGSLFKPNDEDEKVQHKIQENRATSESSNNDSEGKPTNSPDIEKETTGKVVPTVNPDDPLAWEGPRLGEENYEPSNPFNDTSDADKTKEMENNGTVLISESDVAYNQDKDAGKVQVQVLADDAELDPTMETLNKESNTNDDTNRDISIPKSEAKPQQGEDTRPSNEDLENLNNTNQYEKVSTMYEQWKKVAKGLEGFLQQKNLTNSEGAGNRTVMVKEIQVNESEPAVGTNASTESVKALASDADVSSATKSTTVTEAKDNGTSVADVQQGLQQYGVTEEPSCLAQSEGKEKVTMKANELNSGATDGVNVEVLADDAELETTEAVVPNDLSEKKNIERNETILIQNSTDWAGNNNSTPYPIKSLATLNSTDQGQNESDPSIIQKSITSESERMQGMNVTFYKVNTSTVSVVQSAQYYTTSVIGDSRPVTEMNNVSSTAIPTTTDGPSKAEDGKMNDTNNAGSEQIKIAQVMEKDHSNDGVNVEVLADDAEMETHSPDRVVSAEENTDSSTTPLPQSSTQVNTTTSTPYPIKNLETANNAEQGQNKSDPAIIQQSSVEPSVLKYNNPDESTTVKVTSNTTDLIENGQNDKAVRVTTGSPSDANATTSPYSGSVVEVLADDAEFDTDILEASEPTENDSVPSTYSSKLTDEKRATEMPNATPEMDTNRTTIEGKVLNEKPVSKNEDENHDNLPQGTTPESKLFVEVLAADAGFGESSDDGSIGSKVTISEDKPSTTIKPVESVASKPVPDNKDAPFTAKLSPNEAIVIHVYQHSDPKTKSRTGEENVDADDLSERESKDGKEHAMEAPADKEEERMSKSKEDSYKDDPVLFTTPRNPSKTNIKPFFVPKDYPAKSKSDDTGCPFGVKPPPSDPRAMNAGPLENPEEPYYYEFDPFCLTQHHVLIPVMPLIVRQWCFTPETPDFLCPRYDLGFHIAFEHETSRDMYYRCVYGKAVLLKCPSLHHWDNGRKICTLMTDFGYQHHYHHHHNHYHHHHHAQQQLFDEAAQRHCQHCRRNFLMPQDVDPGAKCSDRMLLACNTDGSLSVYECPGFYFYDRKVQLRWYADIERCDYPADDAGPWQG